MKLAPLLVLSLCSTALGQKFELPDRCSHLLSHAQEASRAIDLGVTEKAAGEALAEITARLQVSPEDMARRPYTRSLIATIEGWLIKKEWLGAIARREHDADEVIAYCMYLLEQAESLAP